VTVAAHDAAQEGGGTGVGSASGTSGVGGAGAGEARWRLRGGSLRLDRPRIVAILNTTPDSFSDGGELPSVDAARRRADALVAAGADVLDVGGESTRPGASEVPAAEEVRRVRPVVAALVADHPETPVSIDTRKAAVARAALEAGARIVNDVSGLTFDPEMAGVVAASGAGVVVMHMRGTPADMAARTDYGDDVTGAVLEELRLRTVAAAAAGIRPGAVVLDPGIGFAKTAEQSYTLVRELARLRALGHPILVGPSRKRFIGAVAPVPPRERVAGTIAACLRARLAGASLFRVHDVAEVAQALAVSEAVDRGTVRR
jgi:dihydropteroate synthase